MNKIIIVLTSIFAILVSIQEVSALPLFARQTGMPCSACHFQHFPILNGFGRAFKSAGFTMMGVQGKVEGEGLSIPNTLNMAVLASTGYEKTNQVASSTPAKTTGDGGLYVPGNGGELALFFGGRVNENAGFVAETGKGGAMSGSNTSVTQSSAKLPLMFDISTLHFKLAEGTRAGIIPFTTDNHGASYGFELLNTGANVVHQMSATPGMNVAHSGVLSAQQYIGTAGAATGIAFVASNPMGFINLTKYDQTGTSGAMAVLGSTYLRVAGTFDLSGWDAGTGVQLWRGTSAAIVNGAAAYVETNATALDAQLQGSMGSLPVGFYASYAKAPSGVNAYNMDPAATLINLRAVGPAPLVPVYGVSTRSAFNISVEVGVVPEKLTLGAAIRSGKSGMAVNGSNASDNAILLVATYKLSQNMMASFSLTSASGGYWDARHQDALGSGTTTINLLSVF